MSNISIKRIDYKDEIVNLHYNTKKIRSYEPEEVTSLLQKISGLGYLIGLSEPMVDVESQAIIDFWQSEFADVSFSEVEKAIRLNSSMKLEKKIEHYNKFSTDFLGSVLFYYRSFRAKRLAKHANTVNPPLSMLDTTETDKVALLLMADLETFKELNEKFKKGMVLGFELMHSVRYFETLKRMGKLPEYKNPDKWKEINEEEFRNANSSDKLNGQLVKDSRSYNKALKRYKKYVLEVFLSGLKEMDVEDLQDL